MGRDGVLPRQPFGRLHPVRNTPSFNIWVIGLLALAGALVTDYEADLGLGPKDIGALRKMEWAQLNAAITAAAAKINPPAPRGLGMGSPAGSTPRVGAGPTLDGCVITVRSFCEAAPEISNNVSMLIGSVSEEGNLMSSKPTEAEWHATLAGVFGNDKASALIAAMKKAHPEKSIRTLSYLWCERPDGA